MTDFSGGSYALTGVAAGVLAALGIARLIRALDNLPKALDCAALAGMLGICVGRFNHMFNANDRGQVVTTITELPLVYPVENTITGELEYRFAAFMVQAIVAGTLFAVLTAFYLIGKGRKKLRDGDTCLLVALCYGASQVLLDSTRYDSLFLRSNGFVSMVQILGAVIMAVAIVLFSIRMVKANGFKWWFVALWTGIVGLLTCAGIMEYFVQRRGNEAATFYNVMSVSLLGVVAITVAIRILAVRGEQKAAMPKIAE
jgi:prolipoprotein diacylglyceryltransferase